MANAKKQYVHYKTPVGVAVYPKLHRPYKWDESAERSLPNPDGDYSTELKLSPKDAQPLIDTIQDAIKKSGVKPKNLPYKPEEKDGEETGNTIFKFKAYGKSKDGEVQSVKLVDSVGQAIKGKLRVTSGSRIRLLGWISVAKMGARLNIRAVQIIDLAESNDGEGFGAYEGGSFKAGDIADDTDDTNDNNNTSNETQTSADNEDEF
jgi:hypothetical protein